jgi:hypothetical protein
MSSMTNPRPPLRIPRKANSAAPVVGLRSIVEVRRDDLVGEFRRGFGAMI